MNILTSRQILDRLVAFPTVSSASNLPLVDWVEHYLQAHGIRCFRHWNEDRSKAALIAHAGPWVPGAIVLSGHSDVVPVEGQAWASDPWTVTERDGRLYGRGTCDMKGYVALAVWALVQAQRRGCARPLQLALSYDEEVSCVGAGPMIDTMQTVVPRGSAVLIGEPSGMKVITGHKAGTGFEVHVRGHEVHSSLLPEGISAVMEAARLIQWTNDRNAELQARPPSDIAALFHPPFSTLHVGLIAGGTADNITAADCRFAIEMRVLPDESAADYEAAFRDRAAALDAALKARHPGAGVELTLFSSIPALCPEPGGEAEAIARALTGDNASGVVSYGTEAGLFQNAGYSTVICGPGDIAQAHQADEYLELAEFAAGQRFMERLLEMVK